MRHIGLAIALLLAGCASGIDRDYAATHPNDYRALDNLDRQADERVWFNTQILPGKKQVWASLVCQQLDANYRSYDDNDLAPESVSVMCFNKDGPLWVSVGRPDWWDGMQAPLPTVMN